MDEMNIMIWIYGEMNPVIIVKFIKDKILFFSCNIYKTIKCYFFLVTYFDMLNIWNLSNCFIIIHGY